MTDSNSEHLEPLGDFDIYVDDIHRFGTDAFLLADFTAPRPSDRCADLGTGCGIIPLLWLSDGRCRTVAGVDISERACGLAERSARLNGVGERLNIIRHDIRDISSSGLERESFDIVVCNPPYFTERSGYVSPEPERASARCEQDCSFDDVCAAAVYLLRWGGRLCVCHRPERIADVLCSMRARGIEPKRLRPVMHRGDSKPWLLLIEGRRGGSAGVDFMRPLYMTAPDGSPSDELEAIYARYRKGRDRT